MAVLIYLSWVWNSLRMPRLDSDFVLSRKSLGVIRLLNSWFRSCPAELLRIDSLEFDVRNFASSFSKVILTEFLCSYRSLKGLLMILLHRSFSRRSGRILSKSGYFSSSFLVTYLFDTSDSSESDTLRLSQRMLSACS